MGAFSAAVLSARGVGGGVRRRGGGAHESSDVFRGALGTDRLFGSANEEFE